MNIIIFTNDLTREEMEEGYEVDGIPGTVGQDIYQLSSGERTILEERMESM